MSENYLKKQNSNPNTPIVYISNNIKNLIKSILSSLDNNTYTSDDKVNLEICLLIFQQKLKSLTVSTDLKVSLNKVNSLIDTISPSSNNLLGDLYNLNNCLVKFNEKINKPLYKIKSNQKPVLLDDSPTNDMPILLDDSPTNDIPILLDDSPTNDIPIIYHSKSTIFVKLIVYAFIISIIYYFFYQEY
jgi:hypothetical protein